jgi:Lipase (class 3)
VRGFVMGFPTGYVLQEAQQAIALSVIAYQGENDNDYGAIKAAITSNLGTPIGQGGYVTLVWLGISPDFATLLYVVQDTSVSGRYALVARGTDWNFLTDWVDDLDVVHTHCWPYASPADPSILVSKGSWDGLQSLLTMTSQPDGMALGAVLQQISSAVGTSGLDLFITGHSLGGALATILGLYLADTVSQWAGSASPISMKTYTFASPTTGNQVYADYYDGLSDLSSISWQAFRVYNEQDVVPFGYADVEGIADSGIPCSLLLSLEVTAMGTIVQTILDDSDVSYVHVGNGEPLNNNPPGAGATCANPATTLDDFACWVDYEHSPLTYMSLLGLTPVDLEDHSMDLTSISSANHPRLEEKARALRHK